MSSVPEFTAEKTKVVHDTLSERYNDKIETQLVDIELRIYPNDRELTEYPAIYREKTPDEKYFSQFFYSNKEQFGTGKQYYDDILDCPVTLLQAQADHKLERKQVKYLNK